MVTHIFFPGDKFPQVILEAFLSSTESHGYGGDSQPEWQPLEQWLKYFPLSLQVMDSRSIQSNLHLSIKSKT